MEMAAAFNPFSNIWYSLFIIYMYFKQPIL